MTNEHDSWVVLMDVPDRDWWEQRAGDYWVRFTHHASLPEGAEVSLRFGFDGGEPHVSGLHIETTDGRPLRDRDLRRVSLKRLSSEPGALPHTVTPDLLDDRAIAELRPRRPGRRGYPPEHFRAVADAYRKVSAQHPDAPVKRTAEALHADPSTVRRWLRRARELGYLGEDER